MHDPTASSTPVLDVPGPPPPPDPRDSTGYRPSDTPRIQMYIVVIGAGRTGSKVIELATQDDHDVVVVERDEELAEEASAT